MTSDPQTHGNSRDTQLSCSHLRVEPKAIEDTKPEQNVATEAGAGTRRGMMIPATLLRSAARCAGQVHMLLPVPIGHLHHRTLRSRLGHTHGIIHCACTTQHHHGAEMEMQDSATQLGARKGSHVDDRPHVSLWETLGDN